MAFIIRWDKRNAIQFFVRLPEDLKKESKKSVKESSRQLTEHIKRKYLSGGPSGVGSQSGELRNSTHPRRTSIRGDHIVGGVIIGDSVKARKYRGVHIGPSSKVTRIKPKGGRQFLAIPIGANKNGKFKSPREVKNMGMVPIDGGWLVGPRVKQGGNHSVIPYFLYKKSVNIRASIDIVRIARDFEPQAHRNLEIDLDRKL